MSAHVPGRGEVAAQATYPGEPESGVGPVEYLYLDESGQFEGEQAKPIESFVGGLLTTSDPARVAKVLERLFQAATAHEGLRGKLGALTEPCQLHMLDLYNLLTDEELEAFRHLALRQLRDLDNLRLVSTHYFADAHAVFEGARDAHGAHRFLRMWQSTIRNALYYQPQPGDAALTVYTAQRSVPLDLLEAKERFYMQSFEAIPMGDREGFKVVSSEQVPRLLLGVLTRGTTAPFPRTFQHAEVGGPLTKVTQRQIARQPFLAGLLLADIACDLISQRECGAETDLAQTLRSCGALRVAYHPLWERYERLCESAADSRAAVEELISTALDGSPGPRTPQAWLQVAAENLLASLLGRAAPKTPIRGHFLALARAELARKEGSFPRCERILGEGGLRKPSAVDEDSFDEWILRTAYTNHTGREPADERARLQAELHQVLDTNIETFLLRGEDLAHLAVSHQDEFDYDAAASLIEGHLERARPVFDLLAHGREGAHWTTYGRVLSNLAQTYAYRQADGDVDRARELMRRAKPHMQSWLDRAQWGCHAGNLAAITGDEDLLAEALDVLFESRNVNRLLERLTETQFGPHSSTAPLFGFTVLTRLAVTGSGALAEDLRSRLTQPRTWRVLLDNVRHAKPAHPLELYARHLVELAPPDAETSLTDVLQIALDGFGTKGPSRVSAVMNAGTLAAYGLRLLHLGRSDRAEQAGLRAIETLASAFKANPYISPTTYCEEWESGWFFGAVQQLKSEVTEGTLSAFVERLRYEWR